MPNICTTSNLKIHFGDAELSIIKPGSRTIDLAAYKQTKKHLQLDHLFFLRQTHGVDRFVIDETVNTCLLSTPQIKQGDILITNRPHLGIGIITADCLPIVLHDKKRNVVAAVHAGWRGSVAGVAVKALDAMKEQFGCQAGDISVIFGPSARVCCYEVSDDFLENLRPFDFMDDVVIKRREKLYFDVPRFNSELLKCAGISENLINIDYNRCTMCSPNYNSYRRQGAAGGRQATVAILK